MSPKLGLAERALYTGVSWALAAAFVFVLPEIFRTHWDTWRKAVGDSVFFIAGTWSMNMGMQLLGTFLILPLYIFNIPFFERFRISSKAWPWQTSDPVALSDFRSFVLRSVCLVLFNNFTIGIAGAWNMWWLRQIAGQEAISVEEWPTTLTLVLQLALCCVAEDAAFYWAHRTLHHPALYPHIHKVHHQYYHSFTLASEHAHPVEFLLANLVPLVMGPNLWNGAAYFFPSLGLAPMHTVVLWMWILLRIAVSVEEHCGYEFPWSPMRILATLPGPLALGASPGGHNWHHSANMGMYASQFAWWDALCGTDRAYKEWAAKQEKVAAGEGGSKGKKQR